MISREMIRFFSQHRTLYCYLCLSLWIFLLVAGMYKYISVNNGFGSQTFQPYQTIANQDEVTKIKRLQAECNPYQTINRKEDGGILNGWKLQGVIMLIRHGDRGPMAHVRGINTIDCGVGKRNNILLNKYRTFLLNTTVNAPAGHYIYNKNGPFHNFPLLPAFPKECLLGQLTYNGIAQMLQVGDVLKQVYGHQLGLYTKSIRTPNTTQSIYSPDEIIIYSTRYRRTFQSAMAMLYAFLPAERWLSLNIRESHSLAFCFSDCVCPKADQIKNLISKEFSNQLNKHPTIAAVVQWIGSNVLQNPTPKMKPLEVRDAILSLICHNAPLPCRRNNADYSETTDNDRQSTASTTESNDLINIDQEETSNSIAANIGDTRSNRIIDPDNDLLEPELEGCVETSHVAALMSYTQWQGTIEAQHKLTHQQGLLRSYGLIRHIVANMLKIVSGDKIKFVLYSGHDRTMQFLTTALGLFQKRNDETTSNKQHSYFVPYASRIAFEVYKSDTGTGDIGEYYFRVVYNGVDITREIEFCEGGRSLRISKDSRGNKADLCPIENIIRFIHDDYFSIFNATNQKDACTVQKNNEF